jgi:hypothetical protein
MNILELQNQRLSLSVSATGLLVEDHANGFRWISDAHWLLGVVYDRIQMREEVFLSGFDSVALACTAESSTRGAIKVEAPQFDLALTLTIELLEEKVIFSLPDAGLQERNAARFRLMRLELPRGWGAAAEGEDGYFVLPHWGGVKVPFHQNPALRGEYSPRFPSEAERLFGGQESFAHRTLIYGHQAQWEEIVQIPCYGCVRGAAGYFVWVDAGAEETAIGLRAAPTAAARYSLFNTLYYRHEPVARRSSGDFRLIYHFLQGDECSYAFMGRCAHKYLRENLGVPTLEERCRSNALLERLTRSYDVLIRIGSKVRQEDGKGPMRTFLTYHEAARAVEQAHACGFDEAQITLWGWIREGQDGCYPTIFPIEQSFGSEDDFRRLIQAIDDAGYAAGSVLDYRDAYVISPDFDEASLIKLPWGEPLFNGFWAGGRAFQVCPGEMRRYMQRDLPQVGKLGFKTLSLGSLLGILFDCYDLKHPLTRGEYLHQVRQNLQFIKSLFGVVRVETAIAPILDAVDDVHNLPTLHGRERRWAKSSALYKYFPRLEPIPLQAMAYHGLVLYKLSHYVDKESKLLRCLEYGAGSTSQWDERNKDNFEETLERDMEIHRVLNHQYAHLRFLSIVDHQRLEEGAYLTTYSDGTAIRVDYNALCFSSSIGRVPASHDCSSSGK